MEILTLEFAPQLTPEQEATVRRWLALSRPLWNSALAELIKLDERKRWVKSPDGKGGAFAPVSDVIPQGQSEGKLEERIFYVGDRPVRLYSSCPVVRPPDPGTPEWDEWMPLLSSFGLEAKGGLSLCSSARNLPFEGLQDMPSAFRMGVLAMLDVSWREWRRALGTSSDRGRPKFKTKGRHEFRVLYSRSLSGARVNGDHLLGISKKLGPIKIPGLSNRWKLPDGTAPKIATVKILLAPDGKFKVQLAGDLQREYSAPPSKKSIGIDPGIIYRITHSDGWRKAENRQSVEAQDGYIASLQRQIDHKLAHRFWLWVSHPQRTKEDVSQLIALSSKTWESLSAAQTIEEAIAAIGNYRYQIARHKLPKSNSQRRLEQNLRRYQKKQQARRKAQRSNWASWVARKHGAIAIETGMQNKELRKHGSTLAKRLAEATPGENIAQLERMAKRYGRDFVKIDSAYTTLECPVCGSLNKPDHEMDEEGDRIYVCSCCGWECDEDVSAAVNMELLAFGNSDFELTQTAQYAKILQQKWEAKYPDQLPSWRLSPEEQKAKREGYKEKQKPAKERTKARAKAASKA